MDGLGIQAWPGFREPAEQPSRSIILSLGHLHTTLLLARPLIHSAAGMGVDMGDGGWRMVDGGHVFGDESPGDQPIR